MKNFSLRRVSFALVLVLGIAFSPAARATTIDPLTLEQLASGASFVGVIECETAGGIVARYRVVESWKGAPVGTQFSLRTAVNYWEPQFPVALAGQRSVVTAYANRAPSRIMSTTSGGGVPLWWRNIPFDYSLPLFQGEGSLPKETGKSYYAFGKEFSNFLAFKERVRGFLSLSPEKSEVAILRSVWNKYSRDDKPEQSAQVRELKKRIASASSVALLANALLTLGWKDRDAPVRETLSQGGPATLKFLRASNASVPGGKTARQELIESLESNIKEQSEDDSTPSTQTPAEPPAPDAKTLAGLRRLLEGKATKKDAAFGNFGTAFETLTRHDPASVARFLVNWKNDGKDWSDADRSYVLGSYFAWKCGGNRAVHLRALSHARDPFIRTAGAVYLCFEDKQAGMTALRSLQAVPGDAGVWAALNLARRGDKTAMPRALRVFEAPGESNMEGVPHRNLQKRVLVLLSNSAKKSAMPQPLANFQPPQSDEEEDSENRHAQKLSSHIRAWWKQHEQKIELHDPWLPILEQQKVD